MKTLRILMLAALFASCHLDALFKGSGGGGGGRGSPAGGPKARLTFADQPSQVTAGQVLAPVRVAVLDSAGQSLTDYTGTVTIALANAGGATLAGTQSVDLVGGVAAFTDLSIDKAGSYALRATATGAATATSAPIEVIPPPPPPPGATHLGFVRQPLPTTEAGAVMSPVQVAALDASENVVTAFSDSITVALATGAGGVTLGGTRTKRAVNGAATFSDLSIDLPGVGYTLKATTASLPGITSESFDVTPAPPPTGSAAYLRFTDQPQTTQAGATMPAVRVTAYDGSDNQVHNWTGNVTLTIASNPSNGTLTGGGTFVVEPGEDGIAEYDYLRIDNAGNSYTFRATSPGLRPGMSDPFDITAGPPIPLNGATGLDFFQQPTNVRAGDLIVPAVRVGAHDNNGNLVNYNGPIWIYISVNPGGGTLSGTLRVLAVNGIATFSDLRISSPGSGYRLRTTAWPLVPRTGQAFDVTP